jgi:hypothetical protein
MSVMMRLRSCTLAGNYVQARIKASAPVSDPAALPILPFQVPMLDTPESSTQSTSQQSRRRKKENRKQQRQRKARGKAAAKEAAKPPSLDEFPTLPHDNKVEWEPSTMQDGFEAAELEESSNKSSVSKSSHSDAASTATTASSSVESCRKNLGGYAAAILKPPTCNTPFLDTDKVTRKIEKTVAKHPSTKPPRPTFVSEQTTLQQEVPESHPVVVQPPSWGHGRSFADVMRSC